MRALLPLLLLSSCWLTEAEVLEKAVIPSGDADTDSDTDSDTDTDTDTDTTTTFDCADADLGSAVGNDVVSGASTDHTDDYLPDCNGSGQSGGADAAFGWTAPSAGCFTFDTSEATYDTVLYLLDGCVGGELICNNDVNAGVESTSSVGFMVEADQEIVIIIDALNETVSGSYQLDINPTDFIETDFDLGSQIGTQFGNTDGVDTTLVPLNCDYPSGADVIVNWAAPYAGEWAFSLSSGGTTFDSVLSLHRQCIAEAFICDDSLLAGGGENVDAVLFEGEEILIRIAGYDGGGGPASGAFQLEIHAN